MTHWSQNAYVGQKVVCIDAKTPPRNGGMRNFPLKDNQIYIIKSIDIDDVDGVILFKLQGVIEQWLSSRFRPVQSTDTGMSILKELLINPNKVLEDA